MAHFQVFIPGAHPSKAEAFEAVGLRPLMTDSTESLWVPEGPTKQPGLLFGWFTNNTRMNHGWHPERQEWVPATVSQIDGLPHGRYWVGFNLDDPVTPNDLQRRRIKGSEAVTLGDGRQWNLPIAEELPMTLRRDLDGDDEFCLDEERQVFLAQAIQWRHLLEKNAPLSVRLLRDFCEQALMLNYRVTPEVCDHLNLWSTGHEGTIAQAAGAILRPSSREVVHV